MAHLRFFAVSFSFLVSSLLFPWFCPWRREATKPAAPMKTVVEDTNKEMTDLVARFQVAVGTDQSMPCCGLASCLLLNWTPFLMLRRTVFSFFAIIDYPSYNLSALSCVHVCDLLVASSTPDVAWRNLYVFRRIFSVSWYVTTDASYRIGSSNTHRKSYG